MPYADVHACTGRAGAVGGYFSDSSDPDLADLERFLVQTASQLDAALAAQGLTVPVTDATAAAILEGMNADGALSIALPAAYPGKGTRPDSVSELIEQVTARWEAALQSIVDGKALVVRYLTAQSAAGAGATGTSFWIEEPDYGTLGSRSANEYLEHPGIAPRVSVLDKL